VKRPSTDHSQKGAPLAESILAHLDRGAVRFHVPGHKAGRGAFREAAAGLGTGLWELDLTEVAGLDDLHCPARGGALDQAQTLAAQAFGARRARFLVGGSTAGVLAMVLAAVGPGGRLVATAPFHRSVAAAAVLAGCSFTVVPPRLTRDAGLPVPQPPEVVAPYLSGPARPPEVGTRSGRAAADGRQAGALLVTSPTYHGVAADVAGFASLCRRCGVPLLVDAAHGAHFGFAPGLPPSPCALGADACVVSLHKTAGALTPGSLLLLHSTAAGSDDTPATPALDPGRVEAAVRFVQTSSPPFPVLASLDLARRRLATAGARDWSRTIELAWRTRDEIRRATDGLLAPFTFGSEQDPTRMVFTLAGDAPPLLTGLELSRRAASLGVDLETAGWTEVVAVATPADSEEDHRRLVRALASACASGGEAVPPAPGPGREAAPSSRNRKAVVPGPRRDSALAMEKECWEAGFVCEVAPHEAFRAPRRWVPAARAIGCAASDVVCPYPPGVPLVIPGQRIDEPVARYLEFLAAGGFRVHGLAGSRLEVMA